MSDRPDSAAEVPGESVAEPRRSRFRGLAVMRRFAPHLAEHRRSMAVALSLSVGAVLLEIARPWPLKWIVDEALAPEGAPRFEPWRVVALGVVVALVVAAGKAVLEYHARVRRAEIGHRVARSLRNRAFAALTRLPPSYHAKQKTGDLLVRLVGDVPMIRGMLVDTSVELASRVLLVLGTVTVMLAVDSWLTLIVLAAVPLVLVVIRFLSRQITIAVRKQRRKEGVLADYMHEAVSGVTVLQSLGQGDEVARRFARRNRTSERAGLKATRLAARLAAVVESCLGVMVALTLGLGSLRVLEGELRAGELIVFVSYVRGLLKPVRSLARHGERIAKGTACGERLLEVLDAPVTVTSPPDALRVPAAPRELAFEGVGFRYADGDEVLSDVDLRLRHGRLTGLFGPSGAGKSTLLSLALRLFDPTRGRVSLDGADLRRFDLDGLRQRFGLCLQDTVLFGESVRENLLLGDGAADDERLWAVLREVGAEELVRHLPEGLDTILDSGGGGLSGGERRRLGLARTLLRDPPVLLVDEPFAGLDRASAQVVRDALRRRAARALVLVVAHETEHLPLLDEIAVLDAGRLLDVGSHDDLRVRCEHYARLVGPQPGVAWDGAVAGRPGEAS